MKSLNLLRQHLAEHSTSHDLKNGLNISGRSIISLSDAVEVIYSIHHAYPALNDSI